MMKLVTDVEKDVVAIIAETDEDGDVAVKANGVEVLWIFKGGTIAINNLPSDIMRLKSLGFLVDKFTNTLAVNL